MNRLIHIGFGNIVNAGKIIAIVSPDSAPVKRMVQRAREEGIAIDVTQGRKTKAVLVMENSQLVLSALLPERQFALCHRSYLVNLDYVAYIRGQALELTTGEVLPVSKYRLDDLQKRLIDYLSG